MEKKKELFSDQRERVIPQHIPARRPKGGFKTIPFIIGNEAFERVASIGLAPNMITYLMREYNIGLAQVTNLLFFWSAASNFMPVLGAFLSDSYLGRFQAIAYGSIASFLGMILLWLTTTIPQARPPWCNRRIESCKSPTAGQMSLLMSSFALMSIGAGGTRPCCLPFGADQLDRGDKYPKNQRVLDSFFGWYYASSALSIMIALTGIVYIQLHFGWKVGFGVPVILMLFSIFLFLLASPFYVKHKPTKSLFTSLAQVLVAALRKRKLPLRPMESHRWYHHSDSKLVAPTKKLWFLNRACMIRNDEEDQVAAADASASDPWSLCTTDQVEELKALVKVIPLWSTGIMLSTTLSQSSFPLLQANSMDRHITPTSTFQIPAASFAMFAVIALTTWVALYDRLIIPLASKLKGKPVRLDAKKRMGIGIFLSCMAMIVSAIVEHIRRREAIKEGALSSEDAVLEMSALWLIPQYSLIGLAEAFNAVGQIEFYYTEFPKSMSSIATALFGLGMAFGNLLASVVLSTVDHLTSRGGKESWVNSRSINRARYDNYYCLLAVLSFLNLLYFLLCSWSYGPLVEQVTKPKDEEIGSEAIG
ncbi:protein NRT1/ PTR FAMILY 1.2-like [Corylus avellana]|uniref:protein NRT1/ PTR FAMILY 1.2-like n=1 Tax=Corylus avellana TaxID=13451 RepID=UPI00286C7B5A|nr:protein NRT1/ PTR FAMILY 1.2-like [Corylus avellana]